MMQKDDSRKRKMMKFELMTDLTPITRGQKHSLVGLQTNTLNRYDKKHDNNMTTI